MVTAYRAVDTVLQTGTIAVGEFDLSMHRIAALPGPSPCAIGNPAIRRYFKIMTVQELLTCEPPRVSRRLLGLSQAAIAS